MAAVVAAWCLNGDGARRGIGERKEGVFLNEGIAAIVVGVRSLIGMGRGIKGSEEEFF